MRVGELKVTIVEMRFDLPVRVGELKLTSVEMKSDLPVRAGELIISATFCACKGGEWQLALSLLRTMISARVEVDPFSRTSVICACEGREWHLVLEFAQQDGTS